MIKIDNLTFSYPNSLFSISVEKLNIPQGKNIAIKGPSGSGKSTFLKLVSAQIQVDQGNISLDQINLCNIKDSLARKLRLENFGIISQTPNLIDWMSIRDNIFLPLAFLESKEGFHERYKELLGKFSLLEIENKVINKLSFGEQFRVSIVRALLPKPKYILADEPTASFDNKLRDKAIELLLEESGKIGSTLILVSHEEQVLNKFSTVLNSESWEIEP